MLVTLPFLGQTYSLAWLGGALALAIVTLSAALDMAARVAAARGAARVLWAISAVSVLAIGLWTTSFTLLIGRRFDFPILYNAALTVAGLGVTIGGVILLLGLATRRALPRPLWLGGAALVAAVLLGGGGLTLSSMRAVAAVTIAPIPAALGAGLTYLWTAGLLRAQYRRQVGATPKGAARQWVTAAGFGVLLTVALWACVAAVTVSPLASVDEVAPGAISLGGRWQNTGVAAGLMQVLWLLVTAVTWHFGRLSYSQKFLIVGALFLVPLVVLLALTVNEIADRRDKYGLRELQGVYYLRPAQELLQAVQTQQQLWLRAGRGEVVAAELEQGADRVADALDRLVAMDRETGISLQTTERVRAVQAAWQDLQTNAPTMGQQQRDTDFFLLSAQIRSLIAWVGDTSYLILDPTLDTYYMMDAVVLKLPESQDLLSRLYQASERVLSDEVTTLSPAETAELLVLSGRVRALMAELPRTAAIGLTNDSSRTMRTLVEQPLATATTAATAFTDLVERHIIAADTPDLSRELLAESAERALTANSALYYAMSQALEFGIARRVSSNTTSLILYLVLSGFFSLTGASVGLGVMRAISRPLRQLTSATQQLASGDMSARVPVTGEDEVAQVAAAFNGMVAQLEASTGLLASRTRDLSLAAEVAQVVSQARTLDQLLPQAVDLIRLRFGLYHVQVYLAEADRRQLVLAASTGEAGRELLRRRHRLPLDQQSLNGTAAVTGQPVLITDTRSTPSFRPNALLPETRAELAVPLQVGDRLLGVLDLQSAHLAGLNAANEDIFTVVAGQLAIAIQNGQLFGELRQTLESIEAQSRRLTRSGWEAFLDGINRGERLEAEATRAASVDAEPAVLAAPLAVAGETIGLLSIEAEQQRHWTPEERELVAAVARQAAQQVENLRLLAQAEQYRHEAEQAVRRLTREGWETYRAAADRPEAYVFDGDQVRAAETLDADAPVVTQPLALHGETIGEIALEADALSPEAAEVLAAISARLSAHIDNLRLTEVTQQALAQTEELYAVTASLTEARDLAEVTGVVASVRGATSAGLFLLELDQAGQPETAIYSAGWPQPNPRLGALGARLALREFPEAAELWANPQEPVLVGEADRDERVQPATRALNQQLGVRASAYLPLRLGERWVGLIVAFWPEAQTFSDHDAQLYRAVLAQAAVVVNNRVLFEATRKRADREAVINAINQQIQRATTVEGALETAAREIGQRLRARRMLVEIGTPANSPVLSTDDSLAV